MSLLKSIVNMFLKEVQSKDITEREQPSAARPAATLRREEPQQQTITNYPAYFAEILASEFPQYTVKRDVPVTEIAGFANDEFKLYETRPLQAYKAEWGTPYTFVLYQADKPAGVVMLGSGNSHCKKVKYLIARMYAKKMGLPYINFYTQYPNERAYVVSRIRKFMNA